MLHYKNLFAAIIACLVISCSGPAPKNTLSTDDQAKYITEGKKIAMFSAKALTGKVIHALEAGGVEHAVEYCNLQASPLIDSLSKSYQARIFRVSDKYRNPANKPDSLDMSILSIYRNQVKEGQELQPHLEVSGDQVIYYAPILILNPVCLQCHGEPGSTMEQSSRDFIKSKYPDDKATGYKLGDLRGVWKIMFNV
jgi:hypothetical protein